MSRIFFAVLAAAFRVSPVSASVGDLYKADFTGGIVYKFAPDGSRTVFDSGLSGPEGLAHDPASNQLTALG
jgi:hypothetical protein